MQYVEYGKCNERSSINKYNRSSSIDAIDEIHVAVAIEVVASGSRAIHSRTSRSRSGVMQAEGGDEEPLWCDASREGVSCTNHLVA
jgi:hypothetical protein